MNCLGAVVSESKKGAEAVAAAEKAFQSLAYGTDNYQKHRETLLWALEGYLQYMHHYDAARASDRSWDAMREFGRKLCQRDVIITFNYDSCLERILLSQGKWSPKDGYGFELVFQESNTDKSPSLFPSSTIKTLHLHGAVGWYRKPALKADYPLPPGGGAIPREALTPAPLETKISLDPIFLDDLRVHAIDASLPRRPPTDRQIFLHPTFLKDFESEGGSVFVSLWQLAADALKKAEKVTIIGYSLPEADSAAQPYCLRTVIPQS